MRTAAPDLGFLRLRCAQPQPPATRAFPAKLARWNSFCGPNPSERRGAGVGTHRFQAGDSVVVCGGRYGEVRGTVVRVDFDPQATEHDLITVRLQGDAKQAIMISVFSRQLRLAN